MLSGFPLLRELKIHMNDRLTGNINSLRVLKDTLELVKISWTKGVQGNFMELADFSRLKSLNLIATPVTGDIRDIGEHDFLKLEALELPVGVVGGWCYKFQSISDMPDVMQSIHRLEKHSKFGAYKPFHWYLSELSPDRYVWLGRGCPYPPFEIEFVRAGPRRGWRWLSSEGTTCFFRAIMACEVNWLDPEPDRRSSDYETYIKDKDRIETGLFFYKGYRQPPTEEQYRQLCEEYEPRE